MNPSPWLFPEFDTPDPTSRSRKSDKSSKTPKSSGVDRSNAAKAITPESITQNLVASESLGTELITSESVETNSIGTEPVATESILAESMEFSSPVIVPDAVSHAVSSESVVPVKKSPKHAARKKTAARRNFLTDLDAAGKRLDAKLAARTRTRSATNPSRGIENPSVASDISDANISDAENVTNTENPVLSEMASDAGNRMSLDTEKSSPDTVEVAQSTARDAPWSVSELTARIRGTLEQNFARVTVVGEISDLAQPRSGHAYFTLKDATAQILGVIWRGVMQRLRFDLADGLSVVCRGRLEVYPSRGRYQLIIDSMKPEGVGELELAFRQLHAKLSREGLFDPARKRPIPRNVRRIAVVTSPTGAAIHDFLNVLRRRRRDLEVVIVPVKVQGAGAAEEIANAIDRVNQIFEQASLLMEPNAPNVFESQNESKPPTLTAEKGIIKREMRPFDVLVVTRGGGSLDDLWSFNEECVVRAIARSRLPVISGVGHEIDVTLADLVADLRALTPSEAAERVAPSAEELEKTMRQLGQRLGTALRHRVHLLRRQLDDLAARNCFRDPLRNVRERTRQLDELDGRMTLAVRRRLEMARRDLSALAARLESVSPLAVLSRGYSLTMTQDGAVVRNIKDVAIGSILTTRLNGGMIESRAERIWETSSSQE